MPETSDIVDTLVDGRGVARATGKTVFVQGALKGERVKFVRRNKRRNFDEAELIEILRPAPERVTPRCEVFGICGGCSLQHLGPADQLQLKQSVLIDSPAAYRLCRARAVIGTPVGKRLGVSAKSKVGR